MPALETTGRIHEAVLWPAGKSDRHGQATVGDPISLNPANRTGVRWDSTRKLVKNHNGNEIAIDATVTVDRVIEVGSAMWLGAYADRPNRAGPDVMEVAVYVGADDLKGRHTHHQVHLAKFKGSLPGATP